MLSGTYTLKVIPEKRVWDESEQNLRQRVTLVPDGPVYHPDPTEA
jgi:hypothetical protein